MNFTKGQRINIQRKISDGKFKRPATVKETAIVIYTTENHITIRCDSKGYNESVSVADVKTGEVEILN